jgi:hypothetical protein
LRETPAILRIFADFGRAPQGWQRGLAAVRRIDEASGLALGRAVMTSEKSETKKPLPDRLSLDPRSPYFDQEVLAQGVGIRFNGAEKTNVEEYSISEGWIRVAAGKSRDRHGNPMTIKLNGKVEPYYEGESESE